jgi:hypothetical protein
MRNDDVSRPIGTSELLVGNQHARMVYWTDYTLTGVGNTAGGTVEFTTPPENFSFTKVWIERKASSTRCGGPSGHTTIRYFGGPVCGP